MVARYACRVNGITDWFVTKLDVLSGLEKVPICVAYDVDGVRHDEMPTTQTGFHHAVPVYEEFPGWTEDITDVTSEDDLPQNARDYLKFVEDFVGVPIIMVGVGPGREQTFWTKSGQSAETAFAGIA